MAAYKSEKQYEGEETIVLGFDVGTTQSQLPFTRSHMRK
jgi:hypothetical protein